MNFKDPELKEVKINLNIPEEVRINVESQIDDNLIQDIVSEIYSKSRLMIQDEITGFKSYIDILDTKNIIKCQFKKKGKRYIRKVKNDGIIVIAGRKYEPLD